MNSSWLYSSVLVICLLLPVTWAKARGGGSASSSDVTDAPLCVPAGQCAPPIEKKPSRDSDVQYNWVHYFLWAVGLGLIFGIALALIVIKVSLYYREKKTKMKQMLGRRRKATEYVRPPTVVHSTGR